MVDNYRSVALTARRSSWGSGPRRAVARRGTRRRECQKPTSLPLCRDLEIVRLVVMLSSKIQPYRYYESLLAQGILVFHITCKSPLPTLVSTQYPPHCNVLFSTFFANPKSTSLRCPSASIRMFSGFKSRYATPSRSCRNSNISTISAA